MCGCMCHVMSTVVPCRLTCDLGAGQNSSTTLPIFELLSFFQALICFHVGYMSDTTAIHARLLPSAGICLTALVATGFQLVLIRSGAAAVRSDHRAVLHTCTGAMMMCQAFLRQPPVI